MKRSLLLMLAVLLVVALSAPSVVLASAKASPGKKSGSVTEHSAKGGPAGKPGASGKHAAKEARRATKQLRKQEDLGSLESSPASPSADATKSVGPGVANALSHILANIQRKIAKFGEDVRLSFGLFKVWTKFSTWLGQPTDVKPWETSPTVPPSDISSPPDEPVGEPNLVYPTET